MKERHGHDRDSHGSISRTSKAQRQAFPVRGKQEILKNLFGKRLQRDENRKGILPRPVGLLSHLPSLARPCLREQNHAIELECFCPAKAMITLVHLGERFGILKLLVLENAKAALQIHMIHHHSHLRMGIDDAEHGADHGRAFQVCDDCTTS